MGRVTNANKDKNITDLHDTGRLMKKVRDQAETIKTLRERLKAYELGAAETSRLLDSILAEVANTFGEAAEDRGMRALGIIVFKGNHG